MRNKKVQTYSGLVFCKLIFSTSFGTMFLFFSFSAKSWFSLEAVAKLFAKRFILQQTTDTTLTTDITQTNEGDQEVITVFIKQIKT